MGIVILTLVVSLVEALIILPAHLAHSKALRKQVVEENPSKMKQFFAKMRGINAFGDRIMSFLRDKFYAPILNFVLQFKVLSLGIFVALLVLTFGSIGGGVIGVTIFPSIASDRVSIELDMPNGNRTT